MFDKPTRGTCSASSHSENIVFLFPISEWELRWLSSEENISHQISSQQES
ncbi:hypothetical protein [Anaerotignum lactatifermentans]